MYKQICLPIIILLSSTALAAEIVPMSHVLQNLQNQSYIVNDIELHRDSYQVNAFDANGKQVELNIDAATGNVPTKPAPGITLSDIAKHMETTYKEHTLIEIETVENYYEVVMRDGKGHKNEFCISTRHGKIEIFADDCD